MYTPVVQGRQSGEIRQHEVVLGKEVGTMERFIRQVIVSVMTMTMALGLVLGAIAFTSGGVDAAMPEKIEPTPKKSCVYGGKEYSHGAIRGGQRCNDGKWEDEKPEDDKSGGASGDSQVVPPATSVWAARGQSADGHDAHVLDDSGSTSPSTTESSSASQTVVPATQVWAARGQNATDQTTAEELRVDNPGTGQTVAIERDTALSGVGTSPSASEAPLDVNESGSDQIGTDANVDRAIVHEPADTLAPEDAEVAALIVDPHSDCDNWPNHDPARCRCEAIGGEYSFGRCVDPLTGWEICGQTDLGFPRYCGPSSTPFGFGSSPSASEQSLLASEPVTVDADREGVSGQPDAVSDVERQQVAASDGAILLAADDEDEAEA